MMRSEITLNVTPRKLAHVGDLDNLLAAVQAHGRINRDLIPQ